MKQSLLGYIKEWLLLLMIFQLASCSGGGRQVPTALDMNLSTDEDIALSITLSGTDSNGSIAAYTLEAQPAHGTLSGSVPTLTYTPDADFYGIDSFSFTVTDDSGEVSASGTVTITVNAVNDADPVAITQSIITEEDTAKVIVLAGSDADGTVIDYTIVSNPAHGVLSGTAPNLTYTPAADYFGSDSFSFSVLDNEGGISASAVVSITVNSVNDQPLAIAQNINADEDVVRLITLLGSDSDGIIAGYTLVSPPSHGALTGTAPNLSYTPGADYFGSDSFTFTVSDNGGATSVAATVSITINAVNDQPTATAQSVNLDEDVATAITLAGSDSDGTITDYTITNGPGNGSLSGAAPNLIYTPNADYFGSDSFNFSVTDNDGGASVTSASVSITINAVNDQPTATEQSVTTDEDVATAITLAGSDSDGTITDYTITSTPSNGSLSGTAPNLAYTPAADYFGSDSFSFTVTDNDAAVSVTGATVSITINPVNDAPSFVMGTYQAVNEDAGAQAVVGWASGISTGPLNESAQAASFLVSNDNNALFSVQPAVSSDGTLSYTTAADAFGLVTLSVQLQDDGGTANGGVDTVAAQTFTLNINPLNDLLSLSLAGLPASTGNTVQATLVTDNFSAAGMQYVWQASGDWSVSSGQGTSLLGMLAPTTSSGDSVSLTASSSTGPGLGAVMPLSLSGDATPVLESLTFTPQSSVDSWQLATTASDPNALALTYSWSSGGLAIGATDSLSWTPPLSGQFRVSVEASNSMQSATGSMEYFHVSTAPGAFFRGTRQGIGSRFPVDTSANSGQQKWKTQFTTAACSVSFNFVSGVMQGLDGTLYVGGMDEGKLFAFDPDNGNVKWAFTTATGAVRATPAIAADGTIYAVESNTGTVYAVNPNGTEKWSFPMAAVVSSPVALGADGTLYVGTVSGATSVLYALNPDGSEKWAAPFSLAAETRSSVNFGADGTVYARDYAGYLYAIDPANGSQIWRSAVMGAGSGSSPVIAADGTIYFGSFTSPIKLYAVNPDGSLKWESDMGGLSLYGIGATPAIGSDGTVYIGTWDTSLLGSIFALTPADGSVIWRHQVSSMVQSGSVAIGADGTVFTATQRGIVHALDGSTGAEKWTYDLQAAPNEESPSPLSIGIDGSLYVAACDGVLHAIE